MNTRSASLFLRFVLGFVLLCSLMLGHVTPASAAMRCYVNVNATGLNNGTSWANAFKSLQSALGSSPCTEVWVAKGTYKPVTGTNRAASFRLRNGLALYGGFAGNETLLSERNPAPNSTILSGEIGAAGNADNSFHVVVAIGADSSAVLDGFTITAGQANGASPNDRGGGMGNDVNSNPSLRNLTFSGNSANQGGGIYNAGSPTLASVTFSGNSAGQKGGGMYNLNGSPSLRNVTFSSSSAGQYGGAMYNEQSSPIVLNVTFNGNSATSGGGIYSAANSSPIVKNSILYGDTGQEIRNNSSSATVTYSIVQGGYAGTGNLNADPLLGPLQNNGGFTKTQALGSSSPAIDRGTNTGCPAKDQRGIGRPQDGDANGSAICDMGAYEFQRNGNQLSLFSSGAQDGWILESTETSGAGGTLDSTAETFSVGDSAQDQQGLSILSFNTASLPDTAVITSVTLKIKKAGLGGDQDPFTVLGNMLVDVRKGAFSNNAALQSSDFQALASKNAAMTILNNPVNGWYSKAMGAANLVYINKTGLTQFRLRFALDDNDDMSADYLSFYSGNSTTTTSRPVLIIKYSLP